ncbi:phage portal protein, partial [Bacillus cereus]|uniref:phage portal protein n=1 Tax=Bacillus cereus TaxID=1396 RepID=UPI000BFB04AD
MWETVVGHLALWGNAFVRKIYSVDGRLIDLIPIHPARVTIKVVDGDAVGLPYVKLFVIDGRHDDPLTERDVMHIPAMSLDGVQGMSVIGNMRRTFGLATEAEK